MAKRQSKKVVEPVEPTLEPVNEIFEIKLDEEVELIVDISNTPLEITKEEVIEEVIEEKLIEEKKEDVEEKIVIKELSQKDLFLETIKTVPFIISQNGVVICRSNPYLVIDAKDKYFEINFKKYSYTGLSIQYV